MAYFNDSPVSTQAQDSLGLYRQADEVALALNSTEPPFVLGIHGAWGAGKTSLLRLLKVALGERFKSDKVRNWVVFFEPWRYQHEVSPAVALLQAIREQLSIEQKVGDKAAKIAKTTLVTATAMLDRLISGVPGGLLTTARTEGERIEKAEGRELLGADSLRTLFEATIEQVLSWDETTTTRRLVVLVDDLDRCHDEAVIRLLEAFKLYFSVPNAHFVVAADPRAVERAATRVLFKDRSDDGPALGREYCGKLIQSVWPLPPLADPNQFIKKLWPRDPSVEGRSGEDLVDMIEARPLLPPNPRQIKRYLGELRHRLRQNPALFKDENMFKGAVVFQAMQTFHPDLYVLLQQYKNSWLEKLRWHDSLEHEDEVLQTENEQQDETKNREQSVPALSRYKRYDSSQFHLMTDPNVLLWIDWISELKFTENELNQLLESRP
jgi:hypothetical protein